MRRVVYILLAAEVTLLICAVSGLLGGNAVVLLLAANSVLLIWSAQRWSGHRAARSGGRKPSCCR